MGTSGQLGSWQPGQLAFRIAASEIEPVVIRQLVALLADEHRLVEARFVMVTRLLRPSRTCRLG